MEELKIVKRYLLHNDYPPGYTKADKVNLRCKCRNNFKLEEGMLYYRRHVSDEEEPWRIRMHTEDEKRRVLESCHGGVGRLASLAMFVLFNMVVTVHTIKCFYSLRIIVNDSLDLQGAIWEGIRLSSRFFGET